MFYFFSEFISYFNTHIIKYAWLFLVVPKNEHFFSGQCHVTFWYKAEKAQVNHCLDSYTEQECAILSFF